MTDQQPSTHLYPLFKHFQDEYNWTLTESELQEIVSKVDDGHVKEVAQLRKDRQLLLDWILMLDEATRNDGSKDRVWVGSPVGWLPPCCSVYIGDTLPEPIKQMMKEAGREMK